MEKKYLVLNQNLTAKRFFAQTGWMTVLPENCVFRLIVLDISPDDDGNEYKMINDIMETDNFKVLCAIFNGRRNSWMKDGEKVTVEIGSVD